ncbi:MAG: 6-phosphofructokinase [Oscillospiraceae bacterium]|nr:6-phosphofructokinase [Oscillospiraceae bacterium]
MKTIGVLTSGGDAPGMNAAIRAVTRTALSMNLSVKGIYRGFNGLLTNHIDDFGLRSVSNIIGRGGTVLYTARCPEFIPIEGVRKGVKTCKDEGIDGIVVIGGDGSFRGARDLSNEGIPCVAIPATIDNDIASTGYTIGFDTAMNTAMELMDKLRDTTQSHDRCSVVEVMGRRAGDIALHTGIACGATSILTVEKSEEYTVKHTIEKILNTQTSGKHHFIVVVAEGYTAGMKIDANHLAKQIEEATGVESRATILGHVQRGGTPTVRDRVAASRLGYHSVELLASGKANRVVGFMKNEIVDFEINEALEMKKEFNSELFKVAQTISI